MATLSASVRRGGMVDDGQAERNVTMWAWEGTCRVGYFKIAEMEALLRGPETTGKMGTETKRQERLVHLHLRQGQAMECPHVGMLGGLTILRILRVVVEALRAWTRWVDRLEWEEKEQRGININVHQHQVRDLEDQSFNRLANSERQFHAIHVFRWMAPPSLPTSTD
ncbi:hypothetical protein C8J57DRAFT_1228042 [Mycena rebaudengoi]|nr:hypothetical protein C8J57DRAFT_1228042 [Mycena rebaudengoi]